MSTNNVYSVITPPTNVPKALAINVTPINPKLPELASASTVRINITAAIVVIKLLKYETMAKIIVRFVSCKRRTITVNAGITIAIPKIVVNKPPEIAPKTEEIKKLIQKGCQKSGRLDLPFTSM